MGKKGKPNPDQKKTSQKEKQKKREQNLKDMTFGLKNKGKSKVVQNKINQLQSSVNSNPNSTKSVAAQKARKAQKAAEEEARREMELMFKSVKKKENPNQQQQQTKAEEVKKVVTVKPEVRIKQLLEGTLPEMLERTLEDRIEEARTLVEKKTKMTEGVFKTWLDKKNKRQSDAEKKAKAERHKKGRYTGKEIWFKFKVKVEEEEDAFEDYDKSSNPPSEDEDEDEVQQGEPGQNREAQPVAAA